MGGRAVIKMRTEQEAAELFVILDGVKYKNFTLNTSFMPMERTGYKEKLKLAKFRGKGKNSRRKQLQVGMHKTFKGKGKNFKMKEVNVGMHKKLFARKGGTRIRNALSTYGPKGVKIV